MNATALHVPDEFNSTLGMGTIKQTFPVKNSNRWASLLVFLGGMFGGGAAILYGIIKTYFDVNQYGPVVFSGSFWPPVIIGVVFGVIGLVAGYNAIVNWKRYVVVYERGFAYRDMKGIQSWRWEDVASIVAQVTKHYTNGIYTGTTHLYTLHHQNGDKMTLTDSLTKVEDLANYIREQIFPILYQRLSSSYNSGKPLAFGPVTISRANGISMGKKNYPWDQIAQVSIQKGFIQVAKKGGGWFSGASVPASSVPNIDILISIVNQVVGVTAKK